MGAKPGVDGKLFGSITSKEVADAVKEQFGIEINKKKIELPEIKQFGTFEFTVKLFVKVVAKMKVAVKEQ